jgi:Rrf2 family protein
VKKKDFISLHDLMKDTNLPLRFIARISAELSKYGLLKSKEGRSGGYKITDKIDKISLYEYMRIFERDVEVAQCCLQNYQCENEDICQHQDFLKNKLNEILKKQLKKIKLNELFK